MSEIISEYAVPAIMAAVYLILLMVKPLFGSYTKWLPLAAGVLGVGFNAWLNLGFDFNIFLTGLASGLSATGLDQLIKQSSGYYDQLPDEPVDIAE